MADISPAEVSLAGGQRLHLLLQAVGAVELFGGKQGTAEQGDDAEPDQSITQLRNAVVVAIGLSGELLAGWRGG